MRLSIQYYNNELNITQNQLLTIGKMIYELLNANTT